jgi:lipopolysaccharide biosynthesis regulator YciM
MVGGDANGPRATLPPPDWEPAAPVSRARPSMPTDPLERRAGPKAEEASLAARLAELSPEDGATRAELQAALARHLGAKEHDLRRACELALASLELVEDEQLRIDVARWLEGLGEPAAAAEALRPAARDAPAWVRVGVLLARAGDAAGARAALHRAARVDLVDATALELGATLAAWAPEAVPAASAAAAYLEAAQRRRSAGALGAELEDLLRAFELAPSSPTVAQALATALTERGRAAAASEAWRAHADALEPGERRAVLMRELASARDRGDAVRALELALAAGLDGAFPGEGDPDDVAAFDDVLLRNGLAEALAARLEIAAERVADGAKRARIHGELARLYAGPLSSPVRAAREHVRTLAADPSREEALLALRAYATSTRDLAPLIEGLVRGVVAPGGGEASLRCARLLGAMAEEQLEHRALARWAQQQVLRFEPADAAAGAALERLALGADDRTAWVGALEQQIEGPAWGGGLGRWLLGLELLPPDEVEARCALAAAARVRGQRDEASALTRPLLDGDSPSPRGVAAAWVNAALSGDRRAQARALWRLAESASPAVASVLLCEAADRWLTVGDMSLAARAVAEAARVDPSSLRAVVLAAKLASEERDRSAASALERAIGAVFARGAWCERLATILEALEETNYAVAWSQRLVALRPGDVGATRELLRRVQRNGDAARLADALLWAIPQPLPLVELAPMIAQGLSALASLDAERSAVVARRALEALGPSRGIGAAAQRAASAARDDALAATVLELCLACGEAEPATAWLEVARRRQALSDREGEARALARAVAAGADPLAVEHRILSLEGQLRTGDGELSFLELRAALLARKGAGPLAQRAYRDLGAARWDLADDRAGAVGAWLRAAPLAKGGWAVLASDLERFGGPAFALQTLEAAGAKGVPPQHAAALALEASRVALRSGDPSRAFDLSCLALARDPLLTEVLAVAERASVAAGRAMETGQLYDRAGTRALGRFGRRAAHYRGARFFEQRGALELALHHARNAFLAVPSEGATLQLLRRIAERAGSGLAPAQAVREVARATPGKSARAAWLLRAADLAVAADEEGARLRVDALLEATLLAPATSTIRRLEAAARELVAFVPDERETLHMRCARARKALEKKLEGPDGARVAIAFARAELGLFDDADSALRSLERALDTDADVDEYAELCDAAPRLARAASAREFLAGALALVDKPFSNVGVAALRFLGAFAMAVGDVSAATRLWLGAAERDPDDDALVRTADRLARDAPPGPQLERFEKRVPRSRRVAAWIAEADAAQADGQAERAIAALERAAELADGAEREALEARVREAYEAAGRAGAVEERALREARDPQQERSVRAARWTDVARMREARGDLSGATSALVEAAHVDPEPLERWSEIERIASLSGSSDLRVMALREIELRVSDEVRPAVLRRLARAYEDQGDLAAVEETWSRVLNLAPDDEEADHAVESVIVQRGDYERLAAHLQRRASRLARFPEHRETHRVVRLRRVAILEQRLRAVEQACDELEQLVAEWPENESALRYLADLFERTGRHGRAAPTWQKLASLARDETTRNDLDLRAARALRTDGDTVAAADVVRAVLARSPGNPEALALLAELARAASDDRTLGDALESLAAAPFENPIRRSGMLIEAAQAAARAGDAAAALRRARMAADVAPERAETQLFARGLEYRLYGAGTREQATQTIANLSRIQGPVQGDDAALLAFLYAEAADVVEPGGHGGLGVLEDAAERFGDHALVSVGLAERLAARAEYERAVSHYQIAVNGNLLGLRSRGQVALAGAECATRAGLDAIALRLMEVASHEADTHVDATLRLAVLEAAEGDEERARVLLETLAASTEGEPRAHALAHLGRLLFVDGRPERAQEALRAFEAAVAAVPEGSPLAAELRTEAESLRARAQRRTQPSFPAVAAPGAPATAVTPSLPLPAPPSDPRIRAARARRIAGDSSGARVLLEEALEAGVASAGDDLAVLLEAAGDAAAVLRVRQRQLEIEPGHPSRLRALRQCALLDHNTTWARALDHVARAFDAGAGPLTPPPLNAQVEQPGILALLTRPTSGGVGEVLWLLWEGAGPSFAREPSAYGISGVERVVAGAGTVASRLFEAAVRLLGVPGIPLFVRRAHTGSARSIPPLATAFEMPRPGVALMQPPGALLTGELREDSSAVRYALGVALAAAMPRHALLLASDAEEGSRVLAALEAAFGPTGAGRDKLADAATARMTETFWNTVAPRAQRRIRELLSSALPPHAEIVEAMRQSCRRVGLFLSGDLATAVQAVVLEAGIDRAVPTSPAQLAALAAELPAIADLVRLAQSHEFADARWRMAPEGAPRVTLSSGRFRVL